MPAVNHSVHILVFLELVRMHDAQGDFLPGLAAHWPSCPLDVQNTLAEAEAAAAGESESGATPLPSCIVGRCGGHEHPVAPCWLNTKQPPDGEGYLLLSSTIQASTHPFCFC